MGCEKPAETVFYVEFYVILTTLLVAFLTVFGSWRRRSHSLMLKYSIWASYLLSTYLINYVMGLMKSTDIRHELFAIWATFLIMFLGSADCISAYSLEDCEHRKRYNLEIFLQYFWLGWLIVLHTHEAKFMIPLYLLYFLSLRRTGGRAEALALASKSYGLVRNTKLVADLMEVESNIKGGEADPTCMRGYKYLVKGEKKSMVTVKAPNYHMQFETRDDHKVITIDMIWQCEGRLLSSTGDPDGRLKDICLSYALYRLLCRRFAKYSFSESSQLKTWEFVRYGLLSKEGDHERAFRVIELELGFLYDLFYTKYPVLFAKGLPLFRNFEIIIVIGIGFWVVASLLNDYRRRPSLAALLVTGVVLIAILCMEIVQFFVVNFSDWAKVQWLCYYVKKPLWHNKCIEMIIRVICHRKLFKPWDRKLGQYSLLESFSHNPSILLYNRWTSPYIDKPRDGLKLSAQVTLPMEVKKAIIHSLKTHEQQIQRLTNGVASLRRNRVENELSWACTLKTQTHVIMVWHIATSLCELSSSSQENVTGEQVNQQRESEDFIVATKLSKYCAYLVAFAPRLLPDHPYITEFIFDRVVVEAREKLKGCEKNICQKMFNLCKDDRKKIISEKMLTLGQEDGNQEIIVEGAKLAKYLIETIKENGRRWKILAEFWAEMMLFVAPSDDETAHAEHLAMGGEFVTHLWALLSHAGILKRDSAQDV
ncbi:uncharacterized protein LOC112025829 [Quercus suber]|uniref:DUF4220 domain-containing protein n=1 Tax=Quercus suber TaxID=58331 RepID=A0AAW0L5K4_QUESU|nr:uncharacterized protein LOC112025829 [Quercus suber]POF25788.1 hypothetical protein CFP56_70876 [Quercus suber]